MSDAPIQTVLQQREARPVSGEHLEVLGKKAAADWGMGKVASLHAAVVDAVRGEQLSPEQVHRVVEFCNSAAYLQEFRKEGANHKVIHFDCGPADPAQVIQDLNDGGGGSRFDRGTLDYKMPPEQAHKVASFRSPVTVDFDKTASANETPGADLPKLVKVPSLPKLAHPQARYEAELWGMFGSPEAPMPMAEPLQPLREVTEKIAGARDHLASEVDGLEVDLQLSLSAVYDQVKQASLEGVSLGEVMAAWSSVSPDPVYVKVAFSQMYQRLRAEGVFSSLEEFGTSLGKIASFKQTAVNPSHPLVTSYGEFVETFNKLASTRSLLREFEAGAEYASSTLKIAARGGLLGAAQKGIGAVSSGIDKAAPTVAHALVGSKDAKKLAPTIAKGLKGTALVGGALTANAAVQNVTDRPGVRGVVGAAKSVVPGTMEYQERRYRNMTGQ